MQELETRLNSSDLFLIREYFGAVFAHTWKVKAESAWSSVNTPEAGATEQLALRIVPGKCMVCCQSVGDGSSLPHLPYNWYIWKREMCSLFPATIPDFCRSTRLKMYLLSLLSKLAIKKVMCYPNAPGLWCVHCHCCLALKASFWSWGILYSWVMLHLSKYLRALLNEIRCLLYPVCNRRYPSCWSWCNGTCTADTKEMRSQITEEATHPQR